MGFFEAAQRWRAKRTPLPKIFRNYPSMMELSTVIPYLKETPKKYKNHVPHALSSANITIFPPEVSNFCYIKKYRYRLNFNTYSLILLILLQSLKASLINMVALLMISGNVAALDLFKIKAFWKKGYDVIISVYNVKYFIRWLILYCRCGNVIKNW